MTRKILLILAAFFIVLPAFAQECMDCHEDSVDMAKFKESIHGRQEMGCRDCHGDFKLTDEGHGLIPPVKCESCHDEEADAVSESIHAKAPGYKPLKCKDCHGTHYISSDSKCSSREFRVQMNETCGSCHINSDRYEFTESKRNFVKSYFYSVHNMTIKKGGLVFSATCVDCHGSHSVMAQKNDHKSKVDRRNIPETCGTCHAGVLKEYLDSIHGKRFSEGNTDAPVCTDCHDKHLILNHYDKKSASYPVNIPDTCLKCHSDPKFIKKYGFSSLTKTNYGDSFHGAALKLGDTDVATCVSCHGTHDILRQDNPKSTVYRANLGDTCGKCHLDNNPVNIGELGKVHAMTAKQMHPITKIVAWLYRILIAGTLGFFGFYMSIDMFRTMRNKQKGRK